MSQRESSLIHAFSKKELFDSCILSFKKLFFTVIKLLKFTALNSISTLFNHGTRWRCVLNIHRPNGSHVPRFMELFAAERGKAFPPRCWHGHLKQK